jgi:hypothetical protein
MRGLACNRTHHRLTSPGNPGKQTRCHIKQMCTEVVFETIWQNVFEFQAGPLQSTEAWHSGTRRLAKHQPSHLVAVWPNWTAISTNKFAAQWRDTPKSKITPGILITGCLQFGIAFLCSPKCIFLSTWPGSPGLISRQLGRMRTTSKAS